MPHLIYPIPPSPTSLVLSSYLSKTSPVRSVKTYHSSHITRPAPRQSVIVTQHASSAPDGPKTTSSPVPTAPTAFHSASPTHNQYRDQHHQHQHQHARNSKMARRRVPRVGRAQAARPSTTTTPTTTTIATNTTNTTALSSTPTVPMATSSSAPPATDDLSHATAIRTLLRQIHTRIPSLPALTSSSILSAIDDLTAHLSSDGAAILARIERWDYELMLEEAILAAAVEGVEEAAGVVKDLGDGVVGREVGRIEDAVSKGGMEVVEVAEVGGEGKSAGDGEEGVGVRGKDLKEQELAVKKEAFRMAREYRPQYGGDTVVRDFAHEPIEKDEAVKAEIVTTELRKVISGEKTIPAENAPPNSDPSTATTELTTQSKQEVPADKTAQKKSTPPKWTKLSIKDRAKLIETSPKKPAPEPPRAETLADDRWDVPVVERRNTVVINTCELSPKKLSIREKARLLEQGKRFEVQGADPVQTDVLRTKEEDRKMLEKNTEDIVALEANPEEIVGSEEAKTEEAVELEEVKTKKVAAVEEAMVEETTSVDGPPDRPPPPLPSSPAVQTSPTQETKPLQLPESQETKPLPPPELQETRALRPLPPLPRDESRARAAPDLRTDDKPRPRRPLPTPPKKDDAPPPGHRSEPSVELLLPAVYNPLLDLPFTPTRPAPFAPGHSRSRSSVADSPASLQRSKLRPVSMRAGQLPPVATPKPTVYSPAMLRPFTPLTPSDVDSEHSGYGTPGSRTSLSRKDSLKLPSESPSSHCRTRSNVESVNYYKTPSPLFPSRSVDRGSRSFDRGDNLQAPSRTPSISPERRQSVNVRRLDSTVCAPMSPADFHKFQAEPLAPTVYSPAIYAAPMVRPASPIKMNPAYSDSLQRGQLLNSDGEPVPVRAPSRPLPPLPSTPIRRMHARRSVQRIQSHVAEICATTPSPTKVEFDSSAHQKRMSVKSNYEPDLDGLDNMQEMLDSVMEETELWQWTPGSEQRMSVVERRNSRGKVESPSPTKVSLKRNVVVVRRKKKTGSSEDQTPAPSPTESEPPSGSGGSSFI
ncbi:hypothetical protein EDC01DRAFT_759015 [Geopyxis carbonaria]|nr:hypothetical protein EDC01DRAFT_759015 [Geopyxis carbonaria]